MKDAGLISECSSPWRSNVLLVRKKDNSWRMCVDYRRLNSVTKKDCFPIPNIEDVMDMLKGAKLFSKLDMFRGYYQVPIHSDSVEKTAFATKSGSYAFKVMPFGLTNAPSTFQRAVENILEEFIGHGVIVYFDDILIYTENEEEHAILLDKVLKKLAAANVSLQLKKCEFCVPEIIFLGYSISSEGLRMDPVKQEIISRMDRPKNLKELRSVLGFTGYYRRFIDHYSSIVHCLNKLNSEKVEFIWLKCHENAFQGLLKAMSQDVLLSHPDFSKQFTLTTDASGLGLGAVLSQLDDSNVERPVQFISRGLSKAEVNYTVTELECLAIVFSVKKLRHYLVGRKFVLFTDHSALTYLFNQVDIRGRLVRWILALQEFEFEIRYKPGKINCVADAMSRLSFGPVLEMLAIEAVIPESIPKGMNDEVLLNIKLFLLNPSAKLKLTDEDIKRVQKMSKNFYIEKGNLFKRRFPVVSARVVLDKEERKRFLAMYHDGRGHFSVKRVFQELFEQFWWPTMYQDVVKHSQECHACQMCSKDIVKSTKKSFIISPSAIFEMFGIDFVGPLSVSETGNKYILVITEYMTKWALAIAVPKDDAQTVAHNLFRHVICVFGCPGILVCDRGSHFINQTMDHLCRLVNTTLKPSTSYHPQTNGNTEATNKTLVRILKKYCFDFPEKWDLFLDSALFCYRTSRHSSNDMSPFELLYGVRVQLVLRQPGDVVFNANNRMDELAYITRERSYLLQKRKFDKGQRKLEINCTPSLFQVGQLVLLLDNITLQSLGKKLHPIWSGPYLVREVYSNGTCKIGKTTNGTTTLVNQARLKAYQAAHKEERVLGSC
jgi:hypothetical protein